MWTFFPFFSRVVQNIVFVTNWVADGAPDAKLPRFCIEFRPESNGTGSGPVLDPKIKKESPHFLLLVQATLGSDCDGASYTEESSDCDDEASYSESDGMGQNGDGWGAGTLGTGSPLRG